MEGNIAFVHRFLSSLIFTAVVETAALMLLLRFAFRSTGVRMKDALAAGLFASFMTIPYVWFVFPYLLRWPSGLHVLIAAESFAFLLEALFFRTFLKIGWGPALALSLACNILSYFLGPLLRAHGLWLYW